MPYELAFSKSLPAADESLYINDCCFGGDVVSEALLPEIRRRYGDVQANQEDWGWFIWVKGTESKLAIDIFCDDKASGSFRVHLTSRKKGWLSDKIVDTPELEELKHVTVQTLERWIGGSINVERLDKKYMPIGT